MMAHDDRIEILDWLRGFAALGVAWFHFTNGSRLFDGWILASGALGWTGVEVFFAISGFVIPYAMRRGGYRDVRDAGPFLLKRLARLEPPYLVALLLTLGLLYLSGATPGFRGEPPHVTPVRLLLHIGYLNVFFDRDWLNPAFWTLAVELQFYVAMALMFPLLSAASPIRRYVGLGAMAGLAMMIRDHGLVFPFLPIFAMGAVAFQYRAGLTGAPAWLATCVALAVVSWVSAGPEATVAGFLAAAAAAFVNPPRLPALAALGAVSYSLYLLHIPIGGRVMNLAGRLPEVWHAPALAVAMAVSLICAVGLWWAVERPAQRLAARITYRNVDVRRSLSIASGRAPPPVT